MSYKQGTGSYVTNELPRGVSRGPFRQTTIALEPKELLEKIMVKRPITGKKIDYYSFDLHVINLLKNGFKEVVYPFSELERTDIIEYTVFGGARSPIFGKDTVSSVDEFTIYGRKNDVDRTDIVRMFVKKSRVRNPVRRARNNRDRSEQDTLHLDNI
jgi:hypothetical protein